MTTTFKKVANNAIGDLETAMNSSVTTLVLGSGEGAAFPASDFYLTVGTEVMICSSRSSDTLTVSRGDLSTSAASHLAGVSVTANIMAEAVSGLNTAVNAVEAVLATSSGLRGALGDETGTGALVFATDPVLVAPRLGTPHSGVLSNTTGYTGDTALVTTGVLNSGSINTSFGTINNAAAITGTVITATTNFAGALTGNVTGNASGTAATVTGATQSAITAVGTLGSVDIDGGAIDGVTLGTNSAVTQAIIDNININGTTIGHTSDTDLLTLTSANLAVAGDIEVSGSVEVGTIDFTDGDLAMTIADGGKVTFAAGFAVGSDAAGDTLYSNGTNYVRLAKATDGDVLTLASGVPSWATPTTGDITGITTGDGLSGGATSGTPTLVVDLVSNGGLEFSSGELRVATGISQYDVAQFGAGVIDTDFLKVDGTAVVGRSASEVLSDIGAGAAAGSSSIVTTGALDTGSITSGFGAIAAGGIIKTEDTTAATTILDGSLQTDGGLSVALDAVIGDDLILITDAAVLSLGIGADVKLTHDNATGGTLSGTPLVVDSLGASALANDTYSGLVLGFISNGTIAIGQAVYVHTADGRVALARANAVGTMPAIGVAVTGASDGNPIKILVHGIYNDADHADGVLDEGETMYVSDGTAGKITATIPDADGEFVQVMGMAVGPRDVYINPSLDIIERD